MMLLATCITLLTGCGVDAFFPLVATRTKMTSSSFKASNSKISLFFSSERDQEDLPTKSERLDPFPAAIAALCLLSSTASNAAGPDWGIFEGKTGSLLHPTMMGGMLMLSLSTALLGFDYRRQRTLAPEINGLKKKMPDLNGQSTITGALQALQSSEEAVDVSRLNELKAALPTESQLDALQNERRSLSKKGPRDRHYGQGAILAFTGTIFAIEGPLNTYARAGKLFPGPHLYAGAGLVCLWALALLMVPQMQKGSDAARTVHIGANISAIGLFLWQVQSGIPILLKVWGKTSWP